MSVTEKEFNSFRKVQVGGQFNILDPYARVATGLDKKTYLECINNYTELVQKYGEYCD